MFKYIYFVIVENLKHCLFSNFTAGILLILWSISDKNLMTIIICMHIFIHLNYKDQHDYRINGILIAQEYFKIVKIQPVCLNTFNKFTLPNKIWLGPFYHTAPYIRDHTYKAWKIQSKLNSRTNRKEKKSLHEI